MRLIDADALQAVTECCVDEAGFFAKFNVVHEEEIQKAPTIDPDALRPHKRCDYCKDGKSFIGQTILLANDGKCHTINYCPNCGADMRGNLNA